MYALPIQAASLALLLLSLQVAADPLDHWTRANVGTPAIVRGVAYGNGRYVAVGDQGAIFASPDALSWTRPESGSTNRLTPICFGNGIFVVGEQSVYPAREQFAVLTSADGLSWNRTLDPIPEAYGAINDIICIQNTFVAAHACGIATSTDGVHWVSQ